MKKIPRREFLKAASMAGIGLLIPSCKSIKSTGNKTNVLFISIDDLNDWIEPLGGHSQAITPNLTQFAKQSINFKNAYCSSPMCNPSRTSVMTGYAPHMSGVYSNYQDWREVITDYKSIGNYFRENGYYSAGAGKIFHYHMVDPSCWDEYWPSQKNNMPEYYYPAGDGNTVNMPIFKNMYTDFDWSPISLIDEQTADFKSVEYVISKMQLDHNNPFFLACGIYRPHLPWYVPQKYFDMFPIESIQLPKVLENDLDDVSDRVKDIAHRGGEYHRHVLQAGQWKNAVQGYLASITYADAMFGKLLDGLKKSKYSDNTVIVVWSDHGWQLGEKEHWRKFGLWENIVQSVLMISVPGGTAGLVQGSMNGTACNRIVSLQDIYPTLVELCGLPVRNNIDGRSLIPLLKNPAKEWGYPAITSYDYSEFSVRSERWRYSIYIDGSKELYDHKNDPYEWNNLASRPEYHSVIDNLSRHIPHDPAPLIKTSLKLQPHHYPPFKTKTEYYDWLKHDKDYKYIMDKYWQ
ncbi:sulfatase [Candidatus Neomarinimicrobiota bacterium]